MRRSAQAATAGGLFAGVQMTGRRAGSAGCQDASRARLPGDVHRGSDYGMAVASKRESGRWRRLPGPVLSAARLLTDALLHGLWSPITTLAPCSDRSATGGNGRRCGSRWVLGTGRYPKVLVEPASVRRLLNTPTYRVGMAPINQYAF